MKPGVLFEIPGFGSIDLRVVVSDYTGTHSRGGKIAPAVKLRLIRLSKLVDIHILTADMFGAAGRELKDVPVSIHQLRPERQDLQKMEFVKSRGRWRIDTTVFQTLTTGCHLKRYLHRGDHGIRSAMELRDYLWLSLVSGCPPDTG